ncbi:MAG: DUF72 domain-containing protein [Fibrobacteres bacterium]|nr:DUF72 domain-containing protein [Fibrobacterota bacterium]
MLPQGQGGSSRVPQVRSAAGEAGKPGAGEPGAGKPGAGKPGAWKPQDIPPDLSALGLRVGTGGYSFDDWDGRFYPPAAKARLPFYQLYFSFLELNHTFYQEPLLQQFAELERRSKVGMMYSVKVHRDVSHKGTWDAEEGRSLMRRHAAAVSPLAESGRFYSFLIQLDEGMERGRKALDYLLAAGSAAVSEGLDVHIEFRNRTWHQEAVLQALKDAGIGICNTDLPQLPHMFPLRAYATSSKAYVRYCGRNLGAWRPDGHGAGGSPAERSRARNARYDYLYSPRELGELATGLEAMRKKTDTVAAVFKNHVGAKAAYNALELGRLLAGRGGGIGR